MRLERCRVAHGSTFRLIGEFCGTARRQVERVLAGPVSDGSIVTLDLRKLESCDEVGAEVLVSLTKRAEMAGGALVLRSVPDDVLQSFDAMGVRSSLHIVDLASALAVTTGTAAPTYLFRVDEAMPFAYASSRHDFSLVADDRVWAHRSHSWLLEAGSGTVLAHRVGDTYFSVDTSERLYVEHDAREGA
jgi:anti-anti-sigma regulatory factor